MCLITCWALLPLGIFFENTTICREMSVASAVSRRCKTRLSGIKISQLKKIKQ